jgi:hypothetical protein
MDGNKGMQQHLSTFKSGRLKPGSLNFPQPPGNRLVSDGRAQASVFLRNTGLL